MSINSARRAAQLNLDLSTPVKIVLQGHRAEAHDLKELGFSTTGNAPIVQMQTPSIIVILATVLATVIFM
jgi:hypothetical protein